MENGEIEINATVIANGIIYANGPVFIRGIDIHQAYKDLDKRIAQIEEKDLPHIKESIDRITPTLQKGTIVKDYLEKIADMIRIGKDAKEIVLFIKDAWVWVGPVIVSILFK